MNLTFRIKTTLSYSFFFLFFVFLASLNVINRYYYFIFIAFFIFALVPGRKLFVTPSLIALSVLAISWAIFSPASFTSMLGPLKPFTYMLCYIMGYGFITNEKDELGDHFSGKSFYVLVSTLAAGTLTHYLLNWIKNGNSLDRNTTDIWSGETMAATGQATLACLPLALALACLFSKNSKGLKAVAWIVIAIVMGYNLVLSGRTLVLMLLIVAIFAFLHQLTTRKKQRARSIIAFILVIVALVLMYQLDLFGVRSLVESSALYERFFGEHAMSLDQDSRLDSKLFFLRNMHLYPFGGANMSEQVGYAHDLYLDTYDDAGIFAFVGVVAYIVMTLVRFFRCITAKNLPFAFRQVVFCIYLVVYIQFMLEPILQGCAWLFAAFCLLDGYVARLLATSPRKRNGILAENQAEGVANEAS